MRKLREKRPCYKRSFVAHRPGQQILAFFLADCVSFGVLYSKYHRPMAIVTKWRYSLRWALPHKPCPGLTELASAEVEPGQPCPRLIDELWKPGTGYAVCLDFQQPDTMRRWSQEARARVRRSNLAKRLQVQAPLFADELYAREIEQRAGYFAGERPA